MDWQAVKTEYITTDTSYRKLSEKYHIGTTTNCERAKKEGWVSLRERHRNETVAKTVQKISEKKANRAARYQSVADKLLDKIEAIVDQLDPEDMPAKNIRALTAAVKDLKEIQCIRSDMDDEEQQARIANLRRQAEKQDGGDDVTVTMEGDLADYVS